MAAARAAALRVLQRVSGGATLADALVRERDGLPDSRDRALTSEIATGTLRWRAALDAAIASASGRPVAQIDPAVLEILRLSTYQLRHLDRTPPHAVVHDAVELTRREGHGSAAGFTNAVLRRLARRGRDLARAAEAHADDPLDVLAIAHSHPRWLAARWLDRLGFEAARQWTAFNNEPAPLTLRVNRLKASRDDVRARLEAEGVVTEPTTWASHGLLVRQGNPIGGEAAAAGLFVVQDEASQLVGEFAALRVGRRSLDACAAPGGKTLALVESAPGTALIVAADRRPRRLRLLRDTLRRIGARAVPLVQVDLARGLPFGASFDLVVVDAPCSGLGTLRREPDLKWRRSPDDLAVFSEIQVAMLGHAATAVAPGGRLVYATCSSEPDENDAVAARFLATHSAFGSSDPPGGCPPGSGRCSTPAAC